MSMSTWLDFPFFTVSRVSETSKLLWAGLIRFKQHWRRSSHWSRICSAGDSLTLVWWYSGVTLASSNEAKFLLITVLTKIHKYWSRSAVEARETGASQQLNSLQLNLATAITLMGLVAVTVDYSVSRLAWFLLLVHSKATCSEIPQAKQWSHSSPLPRSLQLWQPQRGLFGC